MTANTGVADPPEPQGYDLVLKGQVGLAPADEPYDPFGDGTRIYACPDCGATWNADDLHLPECRRAARPRSAITGRPGEAGRRR